MTSNFENVDNHTVKAKGGTKGIGFLNWDISKSLTLTMSFQKSI